MANSKGKNTVSIVEGIATPIADSLGLRIWDVRYLKEGSQWFLRIFIDKDGGVDIIDCENVSRALSDVLDREDFIPDAYILEVSSPGLGRQLKKDKDFVRENGTEVEVKLFKAVDGCKEFKGTLAGFDDKTVTVTIDGNDAVFERANISKISLAVDW